MRVLLVRCLARGAHSATRVFRESAGITNIHTHAYKTILSPIQTHTYSVSAVNNWAVRIRHQIQIRPPHQPLPPSVRPVRSESACVHTRSCNNPSRVLVTCGANLTSSLRLRVCVSASGHDRHLRQCVRVWNAFNINYSIVTPL